jgi:redox-sensing transcriptional repressor
MSKGHSARDSQTGEARPSRASVGRLSLYLRILESFQREGLATVSSSVLGEAVGVTDAQVRKDLAYLNLGHPGIGYATRGLAGAIRHTLGIDREWSAVLVGVGNLGRALLRYRGFQEQGFRIVALFDTDPAKIGRQVEGMVVHGFDRLAAVVRETNAELGVLTVPAEAAQEVTDDLAAAGIRGLLNFAPAVLRIPAGIRAVTVDLTVQLEQLAFLVQLNNSDSCKCTPE